MKLPYKLLLFKNKLETKIREKKEAYRVWKKKRKRLKYKFAPRLKTVHERLKQLPVEQQPKVVFLVWMLDVLQYGVAGAVVVIIFFERFSWNNFVPLVFAIGIARWIILDFIENFKRRMVK